MMTGPSGLLRGSKLKDGTGEELCRGLPSPGSPRLPSGLCSTLRSRSLEGVARGEEPSLSVTFRWSRLGGASPTTWGLSAGWELTRSVGEEPSVGLGQPSSGSG